MAGLSHTDSVDRLPSFVESVRLTLRHWIADDAVALGAAIEASLDHLGPWMPWAAEEPSTLEDRLARINRWRAEWEHGGDSVFGVFRDGVVVGGAGLHRRGGPDAVEIGYWIHVDHTRNGYATEAAEALTTAAFEVAGIDRVEIHHDKANIASAGVPQRLGFTLARENPDQIDAAGEIGIECRWVISRPFWAQSRRPLGDGTRVRVVAGLLRRDQRLLLCHRHPDRASYPDVWDLPGGHIDAGESIADALVRELDEELGIQIEVPDQPPWVTMQADHFELNLFLIDRWEGEPRNVATDEHDDIRWVNADELLQLHLAHPSYLKLLQRAMSVQHVVRSPGEADADAMGSVHARAWRAAYSGGLMPDESLDSLSVQFRVDMWRQRLAQPVADRSARLVVEDPAGLVVGFARTGPEEHDDEATGGELYAINVDPDSWGTGAGRALHEAALDALRDAGFERAVLWVLPENRRARQFYEDLGWQIDNVERIATIRGFEVPEVRYSLNLS